IQEREASSVYSSYTPDIPISIESRLVCLSVRQRQVRWRGHPGSTRPGSQVQFIHLVGGVEETTALSIAAQRIQLIGGGIVGYTQVRPSHRERWSIFPSPGC